MNHFSLFDCSSNYDYLESRLSLTSLAAPLIASAVAEDRLPDPEPSPGPYPGEDAPVEYPDPPPSGPVGPGVSLGN
jgi:hypothetical protein